AMTGPLSPMPPPNLESARNRKGVGLKSNGARRLVRSFAFGLVLGLLVWGFRSATSFAQEPAAAPAAASAEAAPAPAAQPKGPDPTGATTGTAADVPVKDAPNPT